MSNNRIIDLEQLSGIFRALSNPNRLRIFMRLVSCCASETACSTNAEMRACVGDIGKDMGIAPSTVSHHIKELRQAGLIRMERRGQKIECWVDPATVRDVAGFFSLRLGV